MLRVVCGIQDLSIPEAYRGQCLIQHLDASSRCEKLRALEVLRFDVSLKLLNQVFVLFSTLTS